jgi:hypothetical protein
MSISKTDRINLKKLVDEMQSDDNTAQIRELKHSGKIWKDIKKMEKVEMENMVLKNSDPEKFVDLCRNECSFLFTHYTDIFNKLLKNEIDMTIMVKLLVVLRKIEEGKVDQHEGSLLVGKILKEMYIDSAIRRGENLDKQHDTTTEKEVPKEGIAISWKQYKSLQK